MKTVGKIVFTFVLSVGIAFGILMVVMFIACGPNDWFAPKRAFDSVAWKRHQPFDPDRQYMVDDLLEHHSPVGMPQNKVIKLLGKPDDQELKRMKGLDWKPGQLTYDLGSWLKNPMSFDRKV